MIGHRAERMDENAVWTAIDAECARLADLLETLSEQEWCTPSLCDGWRVRDVAAHLALAHMSLTQASVALLRARGSFDRMVRDSARRHAAAPPKQVIAEIRSMVGSRLLAPGITHLEPLIDVLVHGQDIAVPLGRPHSMPVDAAATAADRVWTYRWPLSTVFDARARLTGLELVATDTGWSVGHGARVEGPVEALVLLLTARTAALSRLSGPGVRRLRGVMTARRRGRDPSAMRSRCAGSDPRWRQVPAAGRGARVSERPSLCCVGCYSRPVYRKIHSPLSRSLMSSRGRAAEEAEALPCSRG
jgi:uncharacterized protein (TIGR03083 family)